MKLDREELSALKSAVTALGHADGALPADVLRPLMDLAKPGLRLHLDVSASDVVGAPVISVERTTNSDLLAPLTVRQKEVAHLVIKGLSNGQIASELGIALATVKDHVHAILSRLEMPSRTTLIAAARV